MKIFDVYEIFLQKHILKFLEVIDRGFPDTKILLKCMNILYILLSGKPSVRKFWECKNSDEWQLKQICQIPGIEF